MPKTVKNISKPKTSKVNLKKEKQPKDIENLVIESEEGTVVKDKRYYEAIGRRKTAVAQVRLFATKAFEDKSGRITVNNKFYKDYFPELGFRQIIESPLEKMKSLNRFEVSVRVRGGGSTGQAEAIRHGIARTLVMFNADFRKKLKKAGFLKRDPRMKERRKYGLKKARKAAQWSKR